MSHRKTVLIAVVALGLGIVGLALAFSDFGPAESAAGRISMIALFFVLSGFAIGFLHPRAWLLACLSTWGAALFGLVLCIAALRTHGADAFQALEPPYLTVGLAWLFGPLALAVASAYAGRRAALRHTEGRNVKPIAGM